MINKSKFKEVMPTLPPEERIKNFDEVELGFDDKSAVSEASRCLNCKAKPCVSGCPVGVQIPDFIKCIREGNEEEAYKVILKSNSFPAICGRVCPQEKQCEARCVKGKTGEPVSIGRLERYAADKFIAENNIKNLKISNNTLNDKQHKIAVVGSGPSGLTCACELANLGYKVTIFEALHSPGGVLSYGIPEFRLPRRVLNYEIENLKNKNVEICKDIIVGKSLSLGDLFSQGYKAIYISSGAGLPNFMNIPGESMSGIYSANEFLTRINLMKAYKEEYDTPIVKPRHTLIIGGGNVAMDAARCAKRIGSETVTVVYRRTEDEMPARKDEVKHAKEEGIKFLFLSNPVGYFGSNGKVEGAEYLKMKLSEPDASGRKSVVPLSDEKFKIKADTVIVAVGNTPNPIIKDSDSGIEFDERGRIIIDPETMRTSRENVYAGGDIVTGAATVILAMGAGKKAAYQIDKDLKSKKTVNK